MKQKVVMKVPMNCDKCRKNALKVAADYGIYQLEIQGSDQDQVMVIGDDVNIEKLLESMRKKNGSAKLISVEEVKEKKHKGDDKGTAKPPIEPPRVQYHYYHPVHVYETVCDPVCSNDTGCSIL